MKKLLSLGILCAAAIATPLASHATTIIGSQGVTLTFPSSGATSLIGATSITWTSSATSSGTGDYSTIPNGTPLSGSTTIYLDSGHLGGATSATPFTFSIGNLGTFVATTDVTGYFAAPQGQNGSGALFTISGFFTPKGALGTAGFTETSADVTFALTQSGETETGTFSLTSPSNFDPPPPPPPSVPEPSSLALLGTGLVAGVGVIRRRKF